jgi:NTE family protein
MNNAAKNKRVSFSLVQQSLYTMNISVALGSGGSRGNSHIGVLRRLEKEGFRIRAIAGTSFGGLVSIFYASGFTAAEIEDMFAAVDQSKLYIRGTNKAVSLLGLWGATTWFEGIFGEKTFADLKIPCAVTAVDLKSGNEVILTKGRLVDAILATIAVPGVFPARHINGWELVDGGVLDPVPVSVARSIAPDLPVVAVSLNEALGTPARTWTIPMPSFLPRPIINLLARISLPQAADIFIRSQDIVDRALAHYRLAIDNPEVIVRPKVHHIEMLDKVDVHQVAQLGEEALEVVLPELLDKVRWHSRLGRKLFGGKKSVAQYLQY